MTAPTRRAALGALVSFPALALPTGAVALPAALAAQAAAPSAAASAKQEAEGLVEIGRRMPDLLDEFWKASAVLKDARARFDETAPLPPKPRKRAKDEAKRLFKQPLVKIVRDLSGNAPLEVRASHAYESLYDAWSRDGAGGITRKEFIRSRSLPVEALFGRQRLRPRRCPDALPEG